MTTNHFKPRSLDGMKRLAKQLQKQKVGLAYYTALDQAAVRAGYASWAYAKITLRRTD